MSSSKPAITWTVLSQEFHVGTPDEGDGFTCDATYDPEFRCGHTRLVLGALGGATAEDGVQRLAEQCRRFLEAVEGGAETGFADVVIPENARPGGCDSVLPGASDRCHNAAGHSGMHRTRTGTTDRWQDVSWR